MNDAVTIILAIIASCAAAVVTGFFTRPKVSAEATATRAQGEVALSGEARAWATSFREAAERSEVKAGQSEQRARLAEERAEHAEEKAEQIEHRCDTLEIRLNLLIDYTLRLQNIIRTAEHPLPDPPPGLRPPL